ncbi:MAG: MOSC domain-containing protein [Synechococcaceae cyanobacterium SM2_3_1]|nr:MOSC domain-containing protein [Synechococcaceae cyanobacterium SM2_3_1]
MISAKVAGLSIFPIKSLEGQSLTQVKILPSGALQHDREFALFDSDQRFVNGKRQPKVHLIRCRIDLDTHRIALKLQDCDQVFSGHLEQDREAIHRWLSDFFGFPVTLQENPDTGFPDDLNANGPTLISTATLETLASWYPTLTVEDLRQRLRTNIEIDGVPPFWEDQLFSQVGTCVRFQLGEVIVEGINPCQRCVVPSRDVLTGAPIPNFPKIFTQQRQQTLPTWTVADRFHHFYRVAVNTTIPSTEAGKQIQVGDALQILGVGASALA